MKKGNLSILMAFAVIFAISFSSCKKETDSGNENAPEFTTTFSNPAIIKVSSELASNPDYNAQEAYGYASGLKSQLQAYSSFMIVPPNATFSSAKTGIVGRWTWSQGGYDYEYLLEEDALQYEFTYTISYQGSPYYYFEGWELKDGTAGHIDYDLSYASYYGSGETFVIDWTKDVNGTYVIDMKFFDGYSTTPYLRWLGTYNANGSGNITLYDDGTRWYEAMWNANGTGTATWYESDGVTVDYTESW